MYKALVIGCGNIGALYDFNNGEVQTHVKAFHLSPKFSLSIFDIDSTVTKKIADKYNCEIIKIIDLKTLKSFDCVSICTPTETHFSLVKLSIDAGVKVIICEKPISKNITELINVKSIYLNGKSKILTNYIRRFQPSFISLKKIVSKLMTNEILTNVSIRYQKGFINNCSHAFDTIEFLTDTEINLAEIKKNNIIFDYFKDDPTLSLQATWNMTNMSITGLSNVSFSNFEIDLYFEYHKICIKNAGQNIEILKAEKGEQFLQTLNIQDQYTREHCLKNYMERVIENVHELLNNKDQKDNFIQSISLNQKMLNYINS